MGVNAVGNIFGANRQETAGSLAKKPEPPTGLLGFNGAETAGSMANNVGGNFSAMA